MTNLAPLDILIDPPAVLRRWPVDRPVVMLNSGRSHPRWGRWSILAEPAAWDTSPAALAGEWNHHQINGGSTFPAGFARGWIALFSYGLGRLLEPAAQRQPGAIDDRGWPLVHLARIENALIYDHLRGQWWAHPGAGELVAALTEGEPGDGDEIYVAGDLESSLSRSAHAAAVERILEYIRAGDAYQVNLARRLTCSFCGSARALAARALRASSPWYGAYIELPGDRAVISLSPELFLQVDQASRHILTRPIKGTLPASGNPAELLRSEKDAAELHMIVDLMRNDLGRICALGSVRVATARMIETHPTVHHGVGEVAGTLRDDVSIADILKATFPPGSVTGAPKIRAMQIIDELEPVQRGPYCGAVGFIDDGGGMTLNVAIRTIAITGRRSAGRWGQFDEAILDYGTGGGIVADSHADQEWNETEHKAAVLHQALATARDACPAAGVMRTA